MNQRTNIENLYKRPIQSKRTGPLFNAFSYPTKIDPEAVAVFVASHTRPGQVILDPFGGSGSTGIAVRLCDQPTSRMRTLAEESGVKPTWGPRKAIVYELSPLGALLGQVMANPPDPAEFTEAATRLLDATDKQFGWAYAAVDPKGGLGRIRYIIWSEVLIAPCCGYRLTFWDAAVELNPVVLKKEFICAGCGELVAVPNCDREVSPTFDPATGTRVVQRELQPVRVYGESSGKTWSRNPTDADLDLIATVRASPLTTGAPTGAINWGDLHRSGYHTGITRYHHLYTPRNVRAVAELWNGIDRCVEGVRDALRLLILSYNASHSTLMTRAVVKKHQRDFVVTGAQSGVMYVSGLPVEKNVLKGIRRKLKTFAQAFELTKESRSDVAVINGTSTDLNIPDDSVDYVFTDPPFGDFIPYAEVNQVNEAWLGKLTDQSDEAIISRAQGKGVDDYGRIMAEVFSEVARVLRPTGSATVVFHASKPSVWHALGEAFRLNNFAVEKTSVLDKTQVSFKQVVHEGGTRGDALLLIRPTKNTAATHPRYDSDVLDRMMELVEEAAEGDATELAPHRMFTRYVAVCVERAMPIALSAPSFYAYLSERRTRSGQEER